MVKGFDIVNAIGERVKEVRDQMHQIGQNFKVVKEIKLSAVINNESNCRVLVKFHLPNLKHVRSHRSGIP